MGKDVFDYNFELRHFRTTILVSRSMFLRSRNPIVPFIFTFDLDLCKITFLAISQFLMGKTLPNFNSR